MKYGDYYSDGRSMGRTVEPTFEHSENNESDH